MQPTQKHIEEIIKNYKLIAKFMGWRDSKTHKGFLVPPTEINYYAPMHIEDFEYNKKWNLIMPVIHKINKTWKYTAIDGDDFLPAERIIQVIREALGQVDIESVFKQVIEFIKWYNSKTAIAVTPKEVQK